ncbi:MAG: hypothetical protein ABIG42_09740 [bacterium]
MQTGSPQHTVRGSFSTVPSRRHLGARSSRRQPGTLSSRRHLGALSSRRHLGALSSRRHLGTRSSRRLSAADILSAKPAGFQPASNKQN